MKLQLPESRADPSGHSGGPQDGRLLLDTSALRISTTPETGAANLVKLELHVAGVRKLELRNQDKPVNPCQGDHRAGIAQDEASHSRNVSRSDWASPASVPAMGIPRRDRWLVLQSGNPDAVS